jgi:hypothetical protein
MSVAQSQKLTQDSGFFRVGFMQVSLYITLVDNIAVTIIGFYQNLNR